MNDQSGFVAKVCLVSLAIALLIKVAALWFSPTINNPLVLEIVLLPSLLIAIFLTIRLNKISNKTSSSSE